MPRPGQIIPEHVYPHEMVVVNDNTEFTQTMPEQVDDSTHMLFVFNSPQGIDNLIQNVTGGLDEFVKRYGEGPGSIYGQPYLNAYNAHRSGYITGHCLRVTAENATYATSVLVALYRIDETGKMIVKFKTRTPDRELESLDEEDMDRIYTPPTDVITDGDDNGFTEIKLMTVAVRGKGSWGRRIQYGITSNTSGDKENNYKNYIFHVYEKSKNGLVERETYPVCFSEDAIVDNIAQFVDGVIAHPTTGSKYIRTLTNLEGLQELLNAYNDANEDSIFTLDDFDPLLGIDKYTREGIYNYEIDSMSDGVVVLSSTGGISLEGGDDGDFDESNDPELRQAAINAAYEKAFAGEIDPMIVSKNKYPCHLALDANYPISVKIQMEALHKKRGDGAVIFDCGLDIKTTRSPLTYVKNNLDSYLRSRNEVIHAICGKIRDPYSKKILTVTDTYALAYRLPTHWAEYGGRHIPLAGNTYGIIDNDFIVDSIYPIYDEDLHSDLMDEMGDERINYARINAKQRIIIATQLTRQVKSSNLSELNNVCVLLDIKRDCEKLCATYQYNFSEAEDIATFNKDAETVLSHYENAQVRKIHASFDKNDWEAARGILHLYVEMEHKDLVKTSIIEIDVNRGSSSTTASN